MKLFSRLIRMIRINFILMRYNIDEIVLETHWFSPLHFLVYFNPFYWTIRNKLTRGERIRLAIEALGPIFVKAGQILSTRRDILPDDIADELAKLQDRVPPFAGELAKKIIEESLRIPLQQAFSEFDSNALASASIAQVHAAKLHDGKAVVIKVLRPNIKKIIDGDIDILMILANMVERYWDRARHFKPKQIIAEIAQTLYDELDLMREGANASQLRRNATGSTSLYIPKIYWNYSRENILVIERIFGIPIHDIEKLRLASVNFKKLAQQTIETFFKQIFKDSFFHADLHPGNIFISLENPEQPVINVVDFGIVGSLNHKDKRYIAENMVAFFKRDYQRVAELHIASGWLSPDTRIDQFEGAVRSVSEPILEQPLNDVSFGQLLLRLFQVARRFNINIQPQLILLQKTLLNIESLCRQLSPDFDLWGSAAPQIEKWLKKQMGIKAFVKRLRENFPQWSEDLPELPSLMHEVLRETKERLERERFAKIVKAEARKQRIERMKWSYFLGGVILSTAVILSMIYFG